MDAQSESPHQISIRNNICLTYPDNWKIVDIKQIFDVHNGSTPKSSVDAYWNGDISWITPADMVESKYIEKSSRFITSEGFHSCNLTMADPGDIVISCRAPIGSINIVSRPMCTNQGCKLLKPKCEIDTSFYYYFLCSQKDVLNSLGRGTTFMELSTDDLNNYTVPLPDVEIQHRIVSFLDFKCGNLNDIIKYNKSIIDELSNLKQSIISETVTRGLNPNASLKDSGIDWIGMIPNTWNVIKLKYLVTVSNTKSSSYSSFLGLENVESWTGRYIDTEMCSSGEGSISINAGDLCFSKLRPYLAKVIIAPFDGACSSEFIVFNHFDGDVRYLKYLMLTSNFIEEVNSSTYGTKMPRANWDFIGSMYVPNVPFNEQVQISDYLDQVCYTIDSIIDSVKYSSSKIQQYMQSLIYEYVTGKRSVDMEAP